MCISRFVREHQACVQRVVEARQPGFDAGHHAPRVEHEDEVLIALELVLTHGEPLAARGGLPVDCTVLVVWYLIAQARKFTLAAF
jgi:hypothetical protein